MRACVLLCVAGFLLSMGTAFGVKGFTCPSEFKEVVNKLNIGHAVSFDEQASGSHASVYGMLTISASGLDSDGKTMMNLPPIATSDFPSTSRPNVMGVQGPDHQFLGGNSDVLVFEFPVPINAFGLHLIGNPSPTGDTAIPFWVMKAGGETIASETEPLYSLDKGSDVYFLGVACETGFDTVVLYSDNDPAAVYSFNIDDIICGAIAKEVRLQDVKFLESGPVLLSDVVVTRVHRDRFNVQTADRSTGMAVLGHGAERHEDVSIFGTVGETPDGERVITLGQIIGHAASMAPGPLGMSTRAAGGSASVGLQPGVWGSAGPNNIGLDVTVWGTITAISPDFSWMIVDDGASIKGPVGGPAGALGITVVGEIASKYWSVGDVVQVTGSSSMLLSYGAHFPLIRVAELDDIIKLNR
jgi:hypothetical protein